MASLWYLWIGVGLLGLMALALLGWFVWIVSKRSDYTGS